MVECETVEMPDDLVLELGSILPGGKRRIDHTFTRREAAHKNPGIISNALERFSREKNPKQYVKVIRPFQVAGVQFKPLEAK